ncbi:MAG: phosphate/phosphite/phosphonate ABC transporter substrate-binding protein [Cytophagales bacterium]|nr:phosphate/phosphite/phosphonate ABC transporter substrate-binding protein [Rhizobacter sp.]
MSALPTPARILGRCARLVAACALVLLAAGCGRSQDKPYEPSYVSQVPVQPGLVYVLAVHPLHSPKRLFQVYQPLVDHLNTRLAGGAQLRLEASANYAAFEDKLKRREAHLALPNPYQALEARQHGYRVFAKMGDDANFRGIILMRKDSRVQHPRDLIGKAVSYPAPTALAATLLPQSFLQQNGVNVEQDLENRYVGTQESSIMNVALGRTAAGTTWPQPWRAFVKEHAQLADQLEVRWTTESLVNNAVVARDDLPPAFVDQLRKALLDLHQSSEGRDILARMELSRFEPATDKSYDVVRTFIERFERQVRLIKKPG